MPNKNWSSIGVDVDLFNEMKRFKGECEVRAGHSFKWGDFFALLMGLYEMRTAQTPTQDTLVAHMGQHDPDEEPLTLEEIKEAGWEPMPLVSRSDLEWVVDTVSERIIEYLNEKLGPTDSEETNNKTC